MIGHTCCSVTQNMNRKFAHTAAASEYNGSSGLARNTDVAVNQKTIGAESSIILKSAPKNQYSAESNNATESDVGSVNEF